MESVVKWPTIGALAAVSALLTAGAYWIGSRHEPPLQKAVQGDSKLESELTALRKEVQLLKQTRMAVPAKAAPVHAPAADSTRRPEPEPSDAPFSEDEEKAAEETNRQIAADLDARYTMEPVDGAWSAGTVRKIRDAAGSLKGARLLEANCAASLCRVVLGHAATDEQHDLGMQLVALDPFKTGVFFDYDKTPGALKTTLYVLREGKTFNDVRQSSL
jgi:hypothetical protein